jgi:hypothetical protein
MTLDLHSVARMEIIRARFVLLRVTQISSRAIGDVFS